MYSCIVVELEYGCYWTWNLEDIDPSMPRLTFSWELSNFDDCKWGWSFARVAIGLKHRISYLKIYISWKIKLMVYPLMFLPWPIPNHQIYEVFVSVENKVNSFLFSLLIQGLVENSKWYKCHTLHTDIPYDSCSPVHHQVY